MVGVLGAWLHLQRAILPSGPPGQRAALDLFFWAPPVLGPLAFAFIGNMGLVGLVALLPEHEHAA